MKMTMDDTIAMGDWLELLRGIAMLSDAAGLDDGDWQLATDDVLLEQFDPYWALRRVTAVMQNMKVSHDAHEASFKKIGRVLDPIRQRRATGEPLRPDWKEVEELVAARMHEARS